MKNIICNVIGHSFEIKSNKKSMRDGFLLLVCKRCKERKVRDASLEEVGF